MEYIIEVTKTDSGTRMVLMTEEVKECFRFIIINGKKSKKESVIYNKNRVAYKGFLYLDKNDMPIIKKMKCCINDEKLRKTYIKGV